MEWAKCYKNCPQPMDWELLEKIVLSTVIGGGERKMPDRELERTRERLINRAAVFTFVFFLRVLYVL